MKYYLNIGRASDLKNSKERRIYRFLEILPGAFSWLTLGLLVLFSWLIPFWVAIFALVFCIYWILKTIYLSIHTKIAYNKMRENERTDWIKKIQNLPIKDRGSLTKIGTKSNIQKNWKDIYHLVIIPLYKEPLEITRNTFKALEKCDYPKEKMIVILTYEQGGGKKTEKVANIIQKEFQNKFYKFLLTGHPFGLPGEIAGKGANETWGGKKAKEKIIDPLDIPYKNIIVSCFDADTVIYPKYFSCLTYHYLTCKNPQKTSFQPIPLFINNIWEAPAISRITSFSATFWHCLSQERPEKNRTFSSHSMSFQALVDVGFWQTNVVSEDSRIFWQCFLYFDGDYEVNSLYYPVAMDANVAKTFWKTCFNIYKQQRRWGYGVADVPYWLFGFLKNKKIPLKKKWRYGFFTFEGYHSWATNALIIFLFGWLPLILGGEKFNTTLLSYNLPILVRVLMTIAMIGLVSSAFLAIKLLPPRPLQYGKWKYLVMVFQWFLIPVSLIFFGAFPCLDAQARLMFGKYMGFWPTEKVRKEKRLSD